ncbi:MAG TPA: OmpA family protein [Syntrophobacteria bacterium]|jgi:outer membrane protein OmpA-like peptidoglycan-associated protein|nr:OmpA family protein [Syntrophobacteria bacterium]
MMVKKLAVTVLVLSLVACAAPQTKQETGTYVGAGVGAATGALVGHAISKDHQGVWWGAAAGALLGGIAGNMIGAYMDRLEADMRAATAGSGAAIARVQQAETDILTTTIKSDLFFDTGSAVIKPGAYAELDRIAGVLNKYPQTMVRVEGHTDDVGAENANMRLSLARAEAVKNVFVQRGVNPTRIQTLGFGESQPISSNRAQNRRVVITLIPIQQG